MSKSTTNQALTSLRECLAQVAAVQKVTRARVAESMAQQGIDLAAEVFIQGRLEPVRLYLRVLSRTEPRQVRQACGQVQSLANKISGVPVLCGQYFSGRAQDIAQQHQINYLDFAGNCLLALPGLHVQKQGRPNPFARKRELKSLFSLKASRLALALLSFPGKSWEAEDLVKLVDISLPYVYKLRKQLLDQELLGGKGGRFWLESPAELLEQWAASYQVPAAQVHRLHVTGNQDITAALAAQAQAQGIAHALTEFAGAELLAPGVMGYHRVTAYWDGPVDQLTASLKARPVSQGENLRLLGPSDALPLLFTQRLDNLMVASPVIVYLDLCQAGGGRAEDAATVVLEDVLQPGWKR